MALSAPLPNWFYEVDLAAQAAHVLQFLQKGALP
jgi:hypothetical protein